MQKLLQETILFDISVENNDTAYGDKWSTIQQQMNKMIYKEKNKNSRQSPVKNILAFKSIKQSGESKARTKTNYPDRKLQASPTKQLTNGQQNYFKGPSKSQYKERESQTENHKQQHKIDRKQIPQMVARLQMFLIDKNSNSNQCSKQDIHVLNRNIDNLQKSFNFPNKYTSAKNNLENQKNTQKNHRSSNKSPNNLILTKQLNSKFQRYGQDERLNYNLKYQDRIHQETFFDKNLSKNYNKVKQQKKSCFESLENKQIIANQPNVSYQRRSSIYKRDIKTQLKINNQLEINSENTKENRIIKSLNQVPFTNFLKEDHFEKYEQVDKLNQIKQKIKENIVNQHDLPRQKPSNSVIILKKNKSQTLHEKRNSFDKISENITHPKDKSKHYQVNLDLNNKPQSEYKKEISDFKSLLKNYNEKVANQREKMKSQRQKSKDSTHLPNIQNKSQVSNSKSKSSFNTNRNSNKNSLNRFKILSETSNLRSLTQQKQKQKQKLKQLNLVLKIDRKQVSSQSQRLVNREEKQQNVATPNNISPVKKVLLSNILNGKFNINDKTNKVHETRQTASKSCFFTNYKSPIREQEWIKNKNNINLEGQTLDQSEEKKLQSSLIQEKRNIQNLLRCQNIVLKDKSNSIHNSHKYSLGQNKQNRPMKGNQIEQFGQRWEQYNEDDLEIGDKESRSSIKEDFSIKNNLNADRNVSLIKLSLNRNKNKLVIIRR